MAENTKLNFDWSKAVCWPTGDEPKQSFDFDGPTPAVAGLTEPEVLPIDQLNRADTAKFLTELAKLKKAGYVLNLNCPWGTGKTWFLKRWLLTLQNQHPVVYIDAWKYDHNDSPLLIILQHIIDALEQQSTRDKSLSEKLRTSKLFSTAKVLGPELVKAMFRVDLEKIREKGEFEAEKSAVDDLASKTTALLLDNISKETDAVDELKMAIATLLDGIVGRVTLPKLSYPLFIFVDELDRCRPTFAIEMLEAIKHVFGIPQIFFVIATDSEQLQHSINAVYGEKFGSHNYLKRFFDASFQLETPSIQNYVLAQNELEIVFNYYEAEQLDIYQKLSKEDFAAFIAGLVHDLSFDLRTTKQWLSRLDLIVKISTSKLSKVPFIALLVISAVKEKNGGLIKNLPHPKYGPDKLTDALRPLFLDNTKAQQTSLTLNANVYAQYLESGNSLKKNSTQSFLGFASDMFLAVSSPRTQNTITNHRGLAIVEYNDYYGQFGSLLENINSLLELSGRLHVDR